MKRTAFLCILVSATLFGCSTRSGGPAPAAGRRAPLFNDLGTHHHEITTKSPEAQRYFDQGLILNYGFNHAEAVRSFQEAARLDPSCAMCSWGEALALGPNINAPMLPEAVPQAWAAVRKALELSGGASERERATIQALSKRYAAKAVEDRKPLDRAYADAMREASRRFPDDLDLATLFAEALMDLSPWAYWDKEGRPTAHTPEILATIESVLARAPEHIAAIHYYIHAVEASEDPARAEAYAEKLGRLVPGAGHLVHMPAHIYMRVGRYHDASLANEQASKADESYLAQCRAQGIYPLAYHPHNFHFLWASATMEGRSAVALEAAGKLRQVTHQGMMHETGYGTLQHYWITPLYALVRFGKWDEVLEQPRPSDDLLYPIGVWHYARGVALAAKGNAQEASGELAKVQAMAADKRVASITIWDINTATALLHVAAEALAGEIAAREGKRDEAVAHLTKAVALEDELNYNEPPDWYYPVRHSLGAALLAANRAAEAEAVYREDLRRNPENGWALFGLGQSLLAQGEAKEAAEVEARFRKAWSRADVTLTASRF